VVAVNKSSGKKQRRGAATVELAVVSPILFAMLFGIIEFGWVFTAQHTMVNAAREGARIGALQGSTVADIEARVQEMLTPLGLESKCAISILEATPSDPFVVVDVTVPREQISLLGDFFGFTGGMLHGRATMRREGM
jgi:hypothetical protein